MMQGRPRPREGYYTLDQQGKAELVARISAFLACRTEIVFAFLYGSFLNDEFSRDIELGVYLAAILCKVK